LHEFLRSKISPERLTTGKRVIDITETQSEVTVTCMDETTYVGHLVIGADGAYSAVRQIMYKKLQERGLLPEVDKKPLHFDKQCVVGKSRNGIFFLFAFGCIYLFYMGIEGKCEKSERE
jgi:2-polyprenyl-6-methoxyphenol hydroxylase-like FAD-dependent oxidoreductase